MRADLLCANAHLLAISLLPLLCAALGCQALTGFRWSVEDARAEAAAAQHWQAAVQQAALHGWQAAAQHKQVRSVPTQQHGCDQLCHSRELPLSAGEASQAGGGAGAVHAPPLWQGPGGARCTRKPAAPLRPPDGACWAPLHAIARRQLPACLAADGGTPCAAAWRFHDSAHQGERWAGRLRSMLCAACCLLFT